MGSDNRQTGRGTGSLYSTDTIVLVLVSACLTEIAWEVFGIRDRLPIVILVVTWLCGAIHRLSEVRQGRRPALKVGLENGRATALTMAAGIAPWLALGFLHSAYPDSPIWTPLQVPVPLYGLGMVLAAATIAGPFIRRGHERPVDSATTAPQLTPETLLPMAAIFLVSGSIVMGLLSVVWLAASSRTYIFAALAAISPSRFSISLSGSQRPLTITPAQRSVLAMSSSGFAFSRTRSARFPGAIVPVVVPVPKYSATLAVPDSIASYGVKPSSTMSLSSR